MCWKCILENVPFVDNAQEWDTFCRDLSNAGKSFHFSSSVKCLVPDLIIWLCLQMMTWWSEKGYISRFCSVSAGGICQAAWWKQACPMKHVNVGLYPWHTLSHTPTQSHSKYCLEMTRRHCCFSLSHCLTLQRSVKVLPVRFCYLSLVFVFVCNCPSLPGLFACLPYLSVCLSVGFPASLQHTVLTRKMTALVICSNT